MFQLPKRTYLLLLLTIFTINREKKISREDTHEEKVCEKKDGKIKSLNLSRENFFCVRTLSFILIIELDTEFVYSDILYTRNIESC